MNDTITHYFLNRAYLKSRRRKSFFLFLLIFILFFIYPLTFLVLMTLPVILASKFFQTFPFKDIPALSLSARGIQFSYLLTPIHTAYISYCASSPYRFLHWQNIAYIETKDTSLTLYYYEGALFNGFPEADEPIPRNIGSPDLSLTLPLDKLDIPFQHIHQIILSEWESRCSQHQYALPT